MNFKQKLKSRKFLAALTGLITGIVLIIAGDKTEGITAVVSSVVAYCAAEGYVDGQVIKSRIENISMEDAE